MCGIVGYIGIEAKAVDVLMEGLHRLEYRGYDSAGIAYHDGKDVHHYRAIGRVKELQALLSKNGQGGVLGIAHTRWATHGKPSIENAHPHVAGKIYVVHNGIIENYRDLRESLEEKGHEFIGETDTEVIAHLIEEEGKKYDFEEAVRRTAAMLRGAYAIATFHEDDPDKLIALRESSPLVLGVGDEQFIIASDACAIVAHTKRVVYIEDNEMVIITPKTYRVKDMNSVKKEKREEILEWDESEAQKEGHDHFMIKEIYEQPQAIRDAMRGRVDKECGTARLGGLSGIANQLKEINRIVFVSCGTSYNAGLIGEYMLEEIAGIPTEVEYASEFRYRKPLVDNRTAVIAISQSGETADTLAAIREAKTKGALTIGIVNAVGSTIARETDAGIYNHAGPEVSVASTKAFTSQMMILTLFAIFLGRQRSLSLTEGIEILNDLEMIPQKIEKILENTSYIKNIAQKYGKCANLFYLGRKYQYPIAIEGALKIKEISYVHAESYPIGELKHGPIALIDEEFASIVLVPQDSVYDKVLSGIEEIKARNGTVLAITTEGSNNLDQIVDDLYKVPKTREALMPLLTIIPLQLLSYYVGTSKNIDVDHPRNLAKSVTVE